jgi:hypothetical protein
MQILKEGKYWVFDYGHVRVKFKAVAQLLHFLKCERVQVTIIV